MTAQSTQIKTQRGFTLIELLVTISIIAIISVVAVALFANASVNARNGKRVAELEAISGALEQNKTTNGYQPLVNTQFASGNYPGPSTTVALDPSGYAYCVSNAGSGTANPAAWAAAACPASYTAISNVAALPAVNAANYKICTIQEGLNNGAASVTCRTNLQ